MKSLAHKLLAVTFIFALATGCASSVTDANIDQQPEQVELQPADQIDDSGFGTDQEMSPIVDKPE